MRSETVWATDKSRRYMGQLCKHFAHKTEVVLNEADGRIRFDFGTLEALAEETGLRLIASAETAEEMGRVQHVALSHLQRFAFRDMTEEEAAALRWREVG